MNGTIDLVVIIPDLKTSGIVARELQILVDGVPTITLNVTDNRVEVTDLKVCDDTTITIELRGIYGTRAMAAPLVHEFIIVDGIPKPRSELFNITILKKS